MPSDPPPSDELIPTRDTLLNRLKDWRDDDSWRDFFNTYWKLVYGVAIKSGLTEEEAGDVVQETVITVARRIPEFKYDPAVCSFKTWLLNLTRWRIIDQIRKRQPKGVWRRAEDTTRTGTLEQMADPAALDLDSVWDREWKQQLLQTALQGLKRKVNPEHYQIYHLCIFKEWPVSRVAQELAINSAQVYLVKHRLSILLKKELKLVEKRLNEQLSHP